MHLCDAQAGAARASTRPVATAQPRAAAGGAQRAHDRHHGDEAVEFQLAYQLRLREALALPIETHVMLYPHYAEPEDWELESAALHGLERSSTPEVIVDCLANFEPWRNRMQNDPQQRVRFEQRDRGFERQMELDDRMGELSSGEYESRARTLMHERESARNRLMQEVTRHQCEPVGLIPPATR